MNTQKLIWGLEELSDRELQERLWTGKLDGEMSSFVEAISCTFDDSGLSRILDTGQPTEKISPEIKEKASRLDSLIRRIPQSAAPMDIIEHPLMEDVRALSAELLRLVKKVNL
jgi:hypothetical protein